jgi:hypothetical protein
LNNQPPPKKVLLAVRPVDLPLVSTALGPAFELILCHTVEDAVAHFSENVGLIACGVRFDSGRMFDLLQEAKSNALTQEIPFYLILGNDEHGYSTAMIYGIRSAARALGASGFADLGKLVKTLGSGGAYSVLRSAIQKRL